KIANSFNSVTIGQSQRGGATVNLGISTGSGTLGLNYTGNSGKWDGSFDVIERQAGTGKLSAELNYGEDGFSVSGNADLGNGLGFGLESGRNGTTGSLTILGSQQGTVDEDGNYEANGNFLGEISGQDIIDLNKTRQDQRDAEENERNPVKDAKDAADAKDARDDDAQEVGGEEGPQGLVDLAFAGLGIVMTAGAAFLAGGGSASPSSPTGGQSGAGNGANPTVGRKPEDEKDGNTSQDGDDEHKKKAAADLEKSLKIKEEVKKRQAENKPDIEVEGLAQDKKPNTATDVPQGYTKRESIFDSIKNYFGIDSTDTNSNTSSNLTGKGKYELKGISNKIPALNDIKNPLNTVELVKKDYENQKVKAEEKLKNISVDNNLKKEMGQFKVQNSKLVDNDGKPLSKDKVDRIFQVMHEKLGGEPNIHLAKMMAINNLFKGTKEVDSVDEKGNPIKVKVDVIETTVYGENFNLKSDYSERNAVISKSLNLLEGRLFGNYAMAIKQARAEGVDIKEIKVNSTFRGSPNGHEGEALDVRSITINKDGKEKVIVLDSTHSLAYPSEIEKFHRALLAQPGANFLWTPWKMFNVNAKSGEYSNTTNQVLRLMNNAEFKTAAVEYNNKIKAINAKQKEIIAKDKLISEAKNDEDKIKKLKEEKTKLEEERKALEDAKKDFGDKKNDSIDKYFTDLAPSQDWDHHHHDHYNLFKAEENKIPKGKKEYENNGLINFNPTN
ncbi:MAG TPA: hypothetical protein PLX69_24735, partial [Leptospiraceae bacterium]|nr:hypothetical protein [Leptospiraceae bacterium]